MAHFGYCIIYVPSVEQTFQFFEQSFGIARRFLHESGDYGELETGSTILAFANHALGAASFPDGYIKTDQGSKPLGVEIALVDADVAKMHHKAIENGGTEMSPPQTKPWGQTVSYVRSPCGILLELCSPM